MIDKYFTAFPITSENGANSGMPGMTLRDYFAAKAMPVAWEAYDKGYTGEDENVTVEIAKHAYQIADEMLEARKK